MIAELCRAVGLDPEPWQVRAAEALLARRRRPTPPAAPRRAPLSHVSLLAAPSVAPRPGPARPTVAAAPTSLDVALLFDLPHPTEVRPPCARIGGGHFPTGPDGACFYGCEDHHP